jgi:biopolymer transport protein ExbB/TolQ
MFETKVVPALQWWLDHTTIVVQSYPTVIAALWFFLLTAAAMLIYSYKMQARLAEQGRFDRELWERTLSLVLQQRIKDATALAQASEGLFPKLYLAALEAAASRKNAADMINTVKEESQDELCRPLAPLTLAGFLAPFIGLLAAASSAWAVYQDAALAQSLGLTRLVPPMAPAAAGLLTGLLAGAVYGFFALRIRKVVAQMHLCGLKLLHTLFEQTVSRYEAQLKRRAAAPEPALAGAPAGDPGAARAGGLPPERVAGPAGAETVLDRLSHHHF